MLIHPTHERLIALGLAGMAKGFEDQRRSPDVATLTFEERLGLLVDREAAERKTRRLTTRLKHPRGLDRSLFQKLVAGDWIDHHEGLLVSGPTGTGKSWLACALAHKVCRDGRRVLYHRVPRLFEAEGQTGQPEPGHYGLRLEAERVGGDRESKGRNGVV